MRRPGLARDIRRVVTLSSGVVAGLLVALFAPRWLDGVPRLVAAYDAGALVVLVLLLRALSRDPRVSRERAAVEDPGRNLVSAIVVVAGLVGIVSAISILGFGPSAPVQGERRFDDALAIVAVVAGWFLIHTTFTYRYAHLYYYDADGDAHRDGGLDFPGTKSPSDYDFAYFSFVLGMTFQVSDVQVTRSDLRTLALGHGLISFGYSTAIIALVVNVASGLIHH